MTKKTNTRERLDKKLSKHPLLIDAEILLYVDLLDKLEALIEKEKKEARERIARDLRKFHTDYLTSNTEFTKLQIIREFENWLSELEKEE